jgi:hypothetical protein
MDSNECPRCQVPAERHTAGECLDRWVSTQFLGLSVADSDLVPEYSSLEGFDAVAHDALATCRAALLIEPGGSSVLKVMTKWPPLG